MIFVAGTMTMNPAVLVDFQRDLAAMAGKVRAERGCRHWSLLVEEPASGLVNVLEQWDDDEALLTHLKQPWILEFLGRYAQHMQGSTLRVYDIAGDRPLPGF
jgi:quinol monooxygenase YgiN